MDKEFVRQLAALAVSTHVKQAAHLKEANLWRWLSGFATKAFGVRPRLPHTVGGASAGARAAASGASRASAAAPRAAAPGAAAGGGAGAAASGAAAGGGAGAAAPGAAVPPQPSWWSRPRVQLAAAGVGLGVPAGAYGVALGGKHLYDLASDPARGLSPEQAFTHHNLAYGKKVQPIQQQINDALLSGDHLKAQQLRSELDSAGGNNWFRRNFLPWFGAEQPASYHIGKAQEAEATAQKSLQEQATKGLGMPGQLQAHLQQLQAQQSQAVLPYQKQMLQHEIDMLNRRMQGQGAESKAMQDMIARMKAIGMRIPAELERTTPTAYAGGVPGNFGAPSPYGTWVAREELRPNPNWESTLK